MQTVFSFTETNANGSLYTYNIFNWKSIPNLTTTNNRYKCTVRMYSNRCKTKKITIGYTDGTTEDLDFTAMSRNEANGYHIFYMPANKTMNSINVSSQEIVSYSGDSNNYFSLTYQEVLQEA